MDRDYAALMPGDHPSAAVYVAVLPSDHGFRKMHVWRTADIADYHQQQPGLKEYDYES